MIWSYWPALCVMFIFLCLCSEADNRSVLCVWARRHSLHCTVASYARWCKEKYVQYLWASLSKSVCVDRALSGSSSLPTPLRKPSSSLSRLSARSGCVLNTAACRRCPPRVLELADPDLEPAALRDPEPPTLESSARKSRYTLSARPRRPPPSRRSWWTSPPPG